LTALYDGQLFYLDREPTSVVVKTLNNVEGLSARRFGAGMHLRLNQDDKLDDYLTNLELVAIPPELIKPIEPSLEDCFIQLMAGQS